MNRIIALTTLTLCFAIGAFRAQAAEPVDELITALQAIVSTQGRFQQRQFDESGGLVATSSGNFRLLRPGYFAWEISVPDNQLIIADPEYVWHYDRDLETVTRRPVGKSLDASPLQVLGGDESVLRDHFDVGRTGSGAFHLVSREDSAGFRKLTLWLEGGAIRRMEILNSLDQRVEIDLEEEEAGHRLTPADFAFTPPPGADLFYHDE